LRYVPKQLSIVRAERWMRNRFELLKWISASSERESKFIQNFLWEHFLPSRERIEHRRTSLRFARAVQRKNASFSTLTEICICRSLGAYSPLKKNNKTFAGYYLVSSRWSLVVLLAKRVYASTNPAPLLSVYAKHYVILITSVVICISFEDTRNSIVQPAKRTWTATRHWLLSRIYRLIVNTHGVKQQTFRCL